MVSALWRSKVGVKVPFRVRWSADERSRDRPDGTRPALARERIGSATDGSVSRPLAVEGALVYAQPLRILSTAPHAAGATAPTR